MIRLLLAVLLCLWTGLAAAAAGPSPDESQLLEMLNAERRQMGLGQFQLDARLSAAARTHSGRMAAHGTISHHFPEEPELVARLAETGVRFSAAAENVAMTGSVEQAHRGLMNSPGHFKNISNPVYNRVGLGIVRERGRVYVTQNFAKAQASYSDAEFRAELLGALNGMRRRAGLGELLLSPEPMLRKAACIGTAPAALRRQLPEAAELVSFSAAEPGNLPAPLAGAVGKPALRRVGLGICEKPEGRSGLSSFAVVAVFYR